MDLFKTNTVCKYYRKILQESTERSLVFEAVTFNYNLLYTGKLEAQIFQYLDISSMVIL